MEFDFTDIIANIPEAIDYKRRHYYTNIHHIEADREPKSEWMFHVIDHNNKEGDVTPSELIYIMGMKPVQNPLESILKYLDPNTRRKMVGWYTIRRMFKSVIIYNNNDENKM